MYMVFHLVFFTFLAISHSFETCVCLGISVTSVTGLAAASPSRLRDIKMSQLKRKTDRYARSGEDMLEVLADDLSRYELLSAEETDEFLREVEGQHVPVILTADYSEQSASVLDSNSKNGNATLTERFVNVTSEDCDRFLMANVNKNTKYKTNSDIKLFYMWAKENSEHREIQDIPPAELDSLLARMYLGWSKCTLSCVGVVGVGGVAALPLLGFTASGVAGGSWAAFWIAYLGSVKAGSLFDFLQSLGAKGLSCKDAGGVFGVCGRICSFIEDRANCT